MSYYGYMGVATALAGNIFYQYTPQFKCDVYNETDRLYDFAFDNMTSKEARCYYYEPDGCDSEMLSGLSDSELNACFEDKSKVECTNWVYNDPVMNDTIIKGKYYSPISIPFTRRFYP